MLSDPTALNILLVMDFLTRREEGDGGLTKMTHLSRMVLFIAWFLL